jgi:hypothetical protein
VTRSKKFHQSTKAIFSINLQFTNPSQIPILKGVWLPKPRSRPLDLGNPYPNNNQPCVCGYEELIGAIWGEAFGHEPNEVQRLVWGIKKKIERDSAEPRFLKTVRGQGYVLDIRIQ